MYTFSRNAFEGKEAYSVRASEKSRANVSWVVC